MRGPFLPFLESPVMTKIPELLEGLFCVTGRPGS